MKNTLCRYSAIGKTNVKDGSVKKEEDDSKDKNIGCAFHCGAGLLTISFHIRSADVMKAYLCMF